MDIRVGDVVKLKSGGAEMTVARFEDINGVPNAVCGWHVGKKPELRTYPLHMLELVRR